MTGLRDRVVLATVLALTTWAALLSWRGFAALPGAYLRPLLWGALALTLAGAAVRTVHASRLLALVVQAAVGLAVVGVDVVGTPAPYGASWGRLTDAVTAAVEASRTYAPPVGPDVAPLAPLLLPLGLVAVLAADLVVAGLRRPAAAAAPLLVVLVAPIAVLGDTVPWWVFLLTALGFAALLFLAERTDAARWGTDVDRHGPAVGLRGTALVTAALAIGVATALPGALPLGGLRLLDLGGGTGGGDGVTVDNPMTDLRRDLRLSADVPVLDVRTDDPDPSYLRIASLTVFNGEQWTAGDRSIPDSQRADGPVPGLRDVDDAVARTSHRYRYQAAADFDSRWLPAPYPATAISAAGDWRYDTSTFDVLAAADGLDTRGLTWTATGEDLSPDPAALDEAGSPAGLVSSRYTQLPTDLPPIVARLTQQVTASAPTDYQAAVALQRFFRTRFVYDLARAPVGDGNDALAAFLSPDGDRRGYCEQFASAMAVMAREIGIPARVAVGFLRPDRIGAGLWQFSSRDLHAWPELYFAGAGWVRFEPTPSVRTAAAPAWTLGLGQTAPTPEAPLPSTAPDGGPLPSAEPSGPRRVGPEPASTPRAAPTAAGAGRAPLVPLGATALLLLLAAPALARVRLRRRRLRGSAEDQWTELGATCADLGRPWSPSSTVRRTGAELRTTLVGLTPHDASTIEAAIEALVGAVERERYAPAEAGSTDLDAPSVAHREATALLLRALREVAPRRRRVRAALAPVSLLGSQSRSRTAAAADAAERTAAPASRR